jgi:hypothetical protein
MCLGWVLLLPMVGHAQTVAETIERGRRYLIESITMLRPRGELALVTLALSKSGSKTDDPVFASLVDRVARSVDLSGYRPESSPGTDNYEAAVVLMALNSVDRELYRPQIIVLGKFLLDRQTPGGPWDYGYGSTGDTSQSQYAILGLWEAAANGLEVPAEAWDRALHWHITRQDMAGGFAYHPTPPPGETRIQQTAVQHSTTAGGVFSMVVCRSNLGFANDSRSRQGGPVSELALLIPVEEKSKPNDEAKAPYKPKVTRSMADDAIKLGTQWMNTHFTVNKPIGPLHYYLYGVERLGAILNQSSFGDSDWYKKGADFLVSTQAPNGSWTSQYSPPVDTSFAILFLSRSTQKTLEKIRIVRLGEATMSGGKGIPKPDGSPPEFLQRQKPRYRAALATQVDEILDKLSDSNLDALDENASVIIEEAKPQQIIDKLGKNRAGLRKMLKHPSPAVREAALWGMARLRDLRLAPLVIDALRDPDPAVYRAARDSLGFLSRRLDGPILPEEPPAKEQLESAIRDWRTWYDGRQVVVEPDQEYTTD